jgi:glycosyltransferase involved in cell wall biosynthesis
METASRTEDLAATPRTGEGLRVLTVTNMYPTPDAPAYGSFIASQVESLREEGVETDVDFIDGRRSKWAYVRALPRIRASVARGRYDLVHAHYGYSGVYPLLFHALPVVVSFCGDDVIMGHEKLSWLKRRVRDYVSARADAVIVKTQEMKDVLGLAGVQVVPNGVDLRRFNPRDRRACRREAGYQEGRRYVLFPYDPSRSQKGYGLAASAMEIVTRELPNTELRVVWGTPPETMPLHYNAADLLLHTSRWEGSPNAVKEALACDLPVVAVASGDLEARLARARGCHLVERSPQALASAILAVLADPDPRAFGRAAVEELDIRATARRIIRLYKSLLA